ncbi:unnamed protein product, partial [Mesorhabditis spiculigera]
MVDALNLNFNHTTASPRNAEPEEENIWIKILTEVSAKSRNTMQGASIIVLGDSAAGKTSLLSKLEKVDNPNKGSALEYHCLSVQPDTRGSSYAYSLGTAGGALGAAENLTLPLWVLAGNEKFAPLLRHALSANTPSKTVVIIAVSLDNPSPVHSLRQWASIMAKEISGKYEPAVVKEAKQGQERFWQEYFEPLESSMTASIAPGLEGTGLLPLEQGVLTENYGVSMIVVVTKADLVNERSEQAMDKVLCDVRRFCLQYGAALVYTTTKNPKNTQLLAKYIVHRAYGLPFTTSAQMIDRDTIFVPAGWDSEKKIEIVRSNITEIDVLEPNREKVNVAKEPEVIAEDTQAFLTRFADMLAKDSATNGQKNVDDAGTTASDSPLASFFSNLLKDKPQSTRTAAPVSDEQQQAQIEKIFQKSVEPDSAA